ncbi:hypothetical protein BDZ89DRAFT_1060485 [Hymenopellis radicata]|nr:hypothetical protein BDZ89DRAFT_1060485 [Hymenopellis radicata]
MASALTSTRPAIVPKRRRTRGACDLCRSRKTKCDGATMPNNRCSNCIAYKEECTHRAADARKVVKQPTSFDFVNYSNPPFDQPEEQRLAALKSQISDILSSPDHYVVPKDPAVIRQLLVDLAHRVRQLEETIRERRELKLASPPSEPFPPSFDNEAVNRIVMLDNSEDVLTHSGLHQLTQNQETALSEGLQKLTLCHGKDRHYGKSSGMMLMKDALDIKREYTGNPEGLFLHTKRAQFWVDQPWQRSWYEDEYLVPYTFPEDDLLHELVELYYQEHDIYMHLIYRPKFERNIAQRLHEFDSSFGALVLAMCAVGARHSNDPRVLLNGEEHTSGWKYYQQIRTLPAVLSKPPTLYDLQLYTVCGIFLNGSTITAETCWGLAGFGIRMAQSIGLHRRPPPGKQRTVEDEEWKRAFWALFAADVSIAIRTGRPVSTTSDDYDLEFPVECDYEYWENEDPELSFTQPEGKPSAVTAWVKYLQLVEWMAFTHRTVFAVKRSDMCKAVGPDWYRTVIVTIDSALCKWVDSMPLYLRWNPHHTDPSFFKQSAYLHVAYYFAQIQLHRPFISLVGKSSSSPISFPSLSICVNAARASCHIVDTYHQRGFRPTLSTQLALFYSTIIILMNVWRTSKAGGHAQLTKDMENIGKCIDILRGQEKRCQIAGRLVDKVHALVADLDEFPLANSVPSLKRSREPDEEPVTLELPLAPSEDVPIPVIDWLSTPDIGTMAMPQGVEPLPLYTDQLGRMQPHVPMGMPGTETDEEYSAWFQEHFPSETFLPPGFMDENAWAEANHPGRLSGGFLASFINDPGFDLPKPGDALMTANDVDTEMAHWLGYRDDFS